MGIYDDMSDEQLVEELSFEGILEEDDVWEDDELAEAIRKLISEKTFDYPIDKKLGKLIRNIPNIISCFEDCSSEEEYRMLAKKENGTLATIQVRDSNTGFQVYAPITLNPYEYKKFYFETLAFCVLTYILFFRDVDFQILSNDVERSGVLNITDQSLPHLLGLEAKFVSGKDSVFMEKIIPGYNSLSVIDKILSIVKNNEKIIQYEKDNGVDVFNYYKAMQKNKEFLLLGRFFNLDEENTEDKNRVVLLSHSDNQLCLLKKSNMNDTMGRSICKMIIQQLSDGNYFPRSLQSLSSDMLESFEITDFFGSQTKTVSTGGKNLSISCEYNDDDDDCERNLSFSVSDGKKIFSTVYRPWYYADLPFDTHSVRNIISILGGDDSIADEYDYNLLIDYTSSISHLSEDNLQFVNDLLDLGDYKRIDEFFQRFIQNQKMAELNNFGDDSEDEYDEDSCLNFDKESFLIHILFLINKYVNEQDETKKEMLDREIKVLIQKYRAQEIIKIPGK